MHHETLKPIIAELEDILVGRSAGKIVQTSSNSFVFEFGVKEGQLFIGVDPAAPRIHLVQRRTRDLQKSSIPLGTFGQTLRTKLSQSQLVSIKQLDDDRIAKLTFSGLDDVGDAREHILIAQLTGRSANLFLMDQNEVISHSLRPLKGDGQQIGDVYKAPVQTTKRGLEPAISQGEAPTLSKAVDDYYQKLEAKQSVELLGKSLLQRVRSNIARLQRLKTNLQKDLAAHGDADAHKRLGDLLLANLTTAKRSGDTVVLTDYYAEGSPSIEVEVGETTALQDAANEMFSRYTKAKRAVEEINKRLLELDQESEELTRRANEIESAIANADEASLLKLGAVKPATLNARKKVEPVPFPGMRRYESSDGYEVIVGRSARDNDKVTFQVGLPNDLWLHAADYPGSHVIVRNSSRKEIPHRTIIEAAQLAAKFSQAGKDSKVTIHYTQRKFVSRIKGAAPGLVRLSRFKTVTVPPGETLKRL